MSVPWPGHRSFVELYDPKLNGDRAMLPSISSDLRGSKGIPKHPRRAISPRPRNADVVRLLGAVKCLQSFFRKALALALAGSGTPIAKRERSICFSSAAEKC